MSPSVSVSARMLIGRWRERGLRSSSGWIIRIVRFIPYNGQVIRAISICRLHGRSSGVRGRRVPVTFCPTKQTAHGIFHGSGQMCAATSTAATAASATAFASFVSRFVFDHFWFDRGRRYHFVVTCLCHVHSSHVVVRMGPNIADFSFRSLCAIPGFAVLFPIALFLSIRSL